MNKSIKNTIKLDNIIIDNICIDSKDNKNSKFSLIIKLFIKINKYIIINNIKESNLKLFLVKFKIYFRL